MDDWGEQDGDTHRDTIQILRMEVTDADEEERPPSLHAFSDITDVTHTLLALSSITHIHYYNNNNAVLFEYFKNT